MPPLSCFTVNELAQSGLIGRFFGHRPKGNVFTEIENLLASKALSDLTAADVEAILSNYEVPRDKASQPLADLYLRALTHFARDGELSAADHAELKQARYVLGLSEAEADYAAGECLRDLYRRRLKVALNDEVLSDAEKRTLEEMATSFGLPPEVRQSVYKEEVMAVIQQAFTLAVTDRRLTTDEERRLSGMAANFGVTLTHSAETLALINRFRLLAQIENGQLPEIQTPLELHRGERCHAQLPCRLQEKRTVTKAVRYSGPSGRIRIMKGLSWRYGYVNVSRVTSEELRQIDTGTLYVSNKRLLFNGQGKNLNVPYKKIIQFTLYTNGLQIERDTGRDQYFLGEGDLELVGAILESALRLAHSA